FARALGEFGATIVLAGNVAGETRTIPVAVYTLLNVRGGEKAAFQLVGVSVALALGALIASFLLTARRGPE
ncbi:MAG: molybdate ABC transporter permease subunit, partial [Acidobacteriota bacterium]